MAGAPQDGAMPVTVGWFWAWPPWVACHCALLAAMVWSSTWVSRLTSPSGSAAPRLSGGCRASIARPGGSSAAVGIRAPPTRTGMTRMPRVRADSISTRTKSFGPAAAASHWWPMSASSASLEVTAAAITSAKSLPS
jgi:hypothetical protein